MGIGQRTARVRQRAGQRFLVQGAEDQNRSKPGINLPNLLGARDAAGEQSLLLRRRSSAIDCWYCLGWLGGFSEEGFSQFVGLIPAAILFSGAGGSVLAVHQINKNRELGAELQLLKSQNPRDEKLGTILERIGRLRVPTLTPG